MLRDRPYLVNNQGKAILSNSDLNSVKKVKVRKEWRCDKCENLIQKGESAIKQCVSSGRGGGSGYIYFHLECCIVKIKIQDEDGVRFEKIEL